MNKNVILLFGGDSDERLVSVASAQAMAQAMGNATLWFWDHHGPIYNVEYTELVQHENPYVSDFKPTGTALFGTIHEAIASGASDNSIFLLGVHGGFGENGELQSLLERAKRPFTGSDAQSSAVAFDKVKTKDRLKEYPIKTSPHVVIETIDAQTIASSIEQFLVEHGTSIVKPIRGGSSVGCFFINSLDEIGTVVEELVKFAPRPFLLERVIRGREITVGVIEDDSGPRALPCTEIVVNKDRVFDYQGKYLGLGTKEITPAPLEEVHFREAQRIAVAAHAALSLDGYSRSDMILSHDGFYFLETNTLPGLTKSSLVPQQLAAAGISMREFLTAQLKRASEKDGCSVK